MRIEDCTKTKDGRPVRIYATDGGGLYPIHGAIWMNSEEGWRVATWTKGGNYDDGERVWCFDLDLHDWRDDIPWEYIKGDWVARDKDGSWYSFETRPRIFELQQVWDYGIKWCLCGVKMPAGPDDWREAIAQRPEGR